MVRMDACTPRGSEGGLFCPAGVAPLVLPHWRGYFCLWNCFQNRSDCFMSQSIAKRGGNLWLQLLQQWKHKNLHHQDQ